MNTKVKLALIVFFICVIISSVGVVKVEKAENTTVKNVSDDITTKNIEQENAEIPTYETTEPETTEESIKETKTVENSKVQLNENTKVETENGNVPSNNSIKSYMDYRCITSTNSKQYKLQHSLAYTGNYGIRMVGDRYCVALGSYYTTAIGQHVDIELKNGNVIKGILADCKADIHTDSTNRINPNGSVVEFIVDTKVLDNTAKIMGDISYVNGWNSKVVNIKVYDTIENF